MALDSKEKRQNAIGVGRPYLRNHFPVATPDGEWRAASGIGWAGNALASPVTISLGGDDNELDIGTNVIGLD